MDKQERNWVFVSGKKLASFLHKTEEKQQARWLTGGNQYKPLLYTDFDKKFLKRHYKGCGRGYLEFSEEGELLSLKYSSAAFIEGTDEQNIDMMPSYKKSYAIRIDGKIRLFGNFSSCQFCYEAGKKSYKIQTEKARKSL